ncbi:MAG: Ig-like domain-containing protein, partial [Candidatus Aenigmatarchaeota archaeon]
RQLGVAAGYILRENVTDSAGRPWMTEIVIRGAGGNVVYNNTDTGFQTVIPPGTYNITISPMELAPIINITFVDVVITGDVNQLADFEQLLNGIIFLDPKVIYNDLFSLNFVLRSQYDRVEYTAVADGPNLYKCRWFDFESRQCLGQWIKIRNDLVPGQAYRQILRSPGDPAFGEGTDKFVLTNITIDGNMTDWDAVLDNAAQVTTDGISGINDPDNVGNAARDLTKSAFTWNDTYLFLYFRRVAAPGPAITMVVYIDMNSDGYLNQSVDRVARFGWTSDGKYTLNLGLYNASNGVADPLTGDGVDEPGNFINSTLIEHGVPGGGGDDLELETRINWTLLNTVPGTPLKFHVSSARGDGSILPAQVEDNMNYTDTMLNDVSIFPDNSGGAKAGNTVTYSHTVKNTGNIADTFDINASSNKKFNFTLAFANGTALTDTDGDGTADVGRLAPGDSIQIAVNITVNATAPTGTIDTTTVKATASLSSATDSAIDVTTVGNLAVFPPRYGRIANNTLISYNHTILNSLGTSPVIDVNATSANGWTATVFFANGTALADTNGNGKPDVGNLSAGGTINITVKVSVPNAALWTTDYVYVTANSSDDPITDSGYVKDTTMVAPRIEVEPDHEDVAGIGSFVFYEHEVYNNGNISDTVDILKNSSLGWPVQLFQADKVTPLPDTNGNSTPDSGLLEENGGSVKIAAKVTVPMTATEGQKDTTTITGVSAASGFVESAHDNTTAEVLVIYNNSARTDKDTLFTIGETVYAKAYGLSAAAVRFVWVDGNATTVRTSPNINVDAAGQAVDEFATNASHTPGNWTLVLTTTDGIEITRTDFLVIENSPPQVTDVTPAAGSVFNTSTTVPITANVTDDTAVDTVIARVKLPNSTTIDVPMKNNGTAYYAGNFTATDLAGIYNVTIIANDTFGNVNNTETTWLNVTFPYFVSISLVNNLVSFGSMAANETNSTSDDGPLPFTIRNDGNVKVNITVSATDLFNMSANPTSNYRFAANSTAGGTYFNTACSLTGWTDMPSVTTLFLCFLDWADGTDQAETEISVTVPDDEPAGAKSSTVTFIASQA